MGVGSAVTAYAGGVAESVDGFTVIGRRIFPKDLPNGHDFS